MKTKNNNLESVRGMAAFAVVICHLVDKIPEISSKKNHMTNLFANWGTESVMIFFILSGIVIHSSFERSQRSSGLFLIQRIVRLHPALLLSIAFSVFTSFLVFSEIPGLDVLIGNSIPVSTLGRGIAPVLYNTNPVIWSLSFEVFFYTIFGCFVIRNSKIFKPALIFWTIISIFSIGLYYLDLNSGVFHYLASMLAFSSIWLVGFYIWKIKDVLMVNLPFAGFSLGMLPLISRLHLGPDYYDPIKYLLFAAASIPLFCFLIKSKGVQQRNQPIVTYGLGILYLFSSAVIFRDNGYSIIVKGLYILLPVLITILFLSPIKHLIRIFMNKVINPAMAYIGKLSYSIYLFHFPILIFIYYTVKANLGLKISLILAFTYLTSYLIELKLQPFLQSRLLKRK